MAHSNLMKTSSFIGSFSIRLNDRLWLHTTYFLFFGPSCMFLWTHDCHKIHSFLFTTIRIKTQR